MNRAELVESEMEKRGWSARDLSRASGVAYTTIRSMIERNFTNASIDNATKICKALGITVDALVSSDSDGSTLKLKTPSNKYAYLPTTISAGLPLSVDAITKAEAISIPDELMGRYAGDNNIFITRVNGCSMNKVIPDGSLIAVIPTTLDSLNNGDIVVFSDEHEYSVKYYYKQGNKLIFKPHSDNPTHFDQVFNINDDIAVHGKVVTYIVNLD